MEVLAARGICCLPIHISDGPCGVATSAGIAGGLSPMGCSVRRPKSGPSWRGMRLLIEAIHPPPFRTSHAPYSFFIQAIQGIAPRDIPIAIDDLDPLQRGSLIHDVQFELFARLASDSLLPVRPGNLERARL